MDGNCVVNFFEFKFVDDILDGADTSDVAFLVVGDPFGYFIISHRILIVFGTTFG